MFWMPEQQNIVILLCFSGSLCRHSTLLFVLFLPHLVLPRLLVLLLLDRAPELLELSEIMFSSLVLQLVFAASLSKQFLQCI